MTREERIYEDNRALGQAEYQLHHTYLRSFPRCVGIVLGNGCNIHCPHCYQAKNGDNLLKDQQIGPELRRELTAFYPYVSTLRLQGGELFVLPGFRELCDDVAAVAQRPVLSISTNGTRIDEAWAERMVRTPFQSITVSIDGGTPETYARMRVGADLGAVLENINRVQRWKTKLGSQYPVLDSFFVIMRSTFREIPVYLETMRRHGLTQVALQTMQMTQYNGAARGEVLEDETEIRELHALLRATLPRHRPHFHEIRLSGLLSLFEPYGLDATFLDEREKGLYTDSDGLGFELCPNPWTTMFIAEDGRVFLCFLSQPIGNLYEEPLPVIWNNPAALAMRSRMIAGRYAQAGCSTLWCSWREGQMPQPAAAPLRQEMLTQIRTAASPQPEEDPAPHLAAVRRLLTEKDRRIAELNAQLGPAREHIQHLEALVAPAQAHIDHLEQKAAQATAHFEQAQAQLRKPLVRLAGRLSRLKNPKP
jgi:MoaA/NifB/PqqE/SkfB family radical SAM enzyme